METTKEVREILLLKSSPHNYNDVKKMAFVLNNQPRIVAWNIDLDDCDKIIRIECEGLKVEEIINSLSQIGIWVEDV
ncbi:hypothetical protein EZS27_011729 [termite gut metagenome]|uniref:NIL domain-containing protein n=1 Tax=termite gut metagenome TaxID=433724 RepID=A0A5J4S3N5_9ZZZZ